MFYRGEYVELLFQRDAHTLSLPPGLKTVLYKSPLPIIAQLITIYPGRDFGDDVDGNLCIVVVPWVSTSQMFVLNTSPEFRFTNGWPEYKFIAVATSSLNLQKLTNANKVIGWDQCLIRPKRLMSQT